MREEKYFADFDRKENLHFDSKAVHGALGADPITGAVSFPIYQSSTFKHREFDVSTGYLYSRMQNPTRQELERTLAILEGGREAFAYTSGQAANMSLFALLKEGDQVILTDDIYGGTFRIADEIFTPKGITFTYVDMSDIQNVENALTEHTRMFFVETPTNPMMKVADIKALSALAKKRNIILTVDNTFLTPYFQRPFELGADIVVHSATKYLCGHNDVVAGAVVLKDETYYEHFAHEIKSRGNGLAPFDSWLILRGLKTLPVRMDRHNENAMKVAQWLRSNKKVTKVYYAGFPDHKSYSISKAQSSGFGGMISFELNSRETAVNLFNKVKMILFAESLGGTETLITYPLTQTHESTPPEVREVLGINDRFVRISVGLEDPRDIIADLEQAMGD